MSSVNTNLLFCSVCYEIFSKETTIEIKEKLNFTDFKSVKQDDLTPLQLKCSHIFCNGCLSQWINQFTTKTTTPTCPQCRTVLIEKPAVQLPSISIPSPQGLPIILLPNGIASTSETTISDLLLHAIVVMSIIRDTIRLQTAYIQNGDQVTARRMNSVIRLLTPSLESTVRHLLIGTSPENGELLSVTAPSILQTAQNGFLPIPPLVTTPITHATVIDSPLVTSSTSEAATVNTHPTATAPHTSPHQAPGSIPSTPPSDAVD